MKMRLFILILIGLIIIGLGLYILRPISHPGFGFFQAKQPQQQPQSSLAYTFVTPTPVTATPAPVTDFPITDFSAYHQIMKPAFADDIEQTIAADITRYQIKADLELKTLQASVTPKISATMRTHYTNTEPVLLNQVYFRLFPNTPGYGSINGGAMTIINTFIGGQPVQTTLVSADSALFVPLRSALEPGQSVEIVIQYEALIPTTTGIGNGLFAYENNILSLAGFYPTIPVFDRRGWHLAVAPHFADAPYTDIALYDVTFTLPAEMVVVASGNIIQTQLHPNGVKTIRMLSGPMRDFFIAMSPSYQAFSQELEGTTITSYFPAGYDKAGQLALDVGTNALTIFGDLFGPYPYQEFDLVAIPVPTTLGGIEYPGVTALAERYYSGDDTFMEFVTAHEVAHQWWYGLVGNDQISSPWLDEALTQYTTVHYYEYYYGPQKGAEIVNEMFSPFYWQLRDTNTDRPVVGPAADFPEALYYPVVYGKGPLFFEAVRNQLGDERYFAGLRQYAHKHRYQIAAPDDLLNIWRDENGQSVEELYQQWILGQ